jgi:energy-coupling factor transporter ATP-binding protein EcfA2
MALLKRPVLLLLDQMHEQIDRAYIPRIDAALSALLPPTSIVVEARSRSTSGLRATAPRRPVPALSSLQWQVEVQPIGSGAATSVPGFDLTVGAAPAALEDQPESTPTLCVERLEHSYASSGFHLGPFDLCVRSGERVSLIGPNGSGKSTLLKCIAMLERPTYARLEVVRADGTVVTPPPKRQAHRWASHALYCFQRPEDQLYLATVREELSETSRRLGNAHTMSKAVKIAERLGLGSYFDRSPYDIPRSFRRLIPIAGALAVSPPLLLLDEPTVGLDDYLVAELIKLLAETQETTSTIFISHDQAFTAAAATRLVDIRNL